MSNYQSHYLRSLSDPEGFWSEAAAELYWHKAWDKTLDTAARPMPSWFAHGELNTCYNALDRHVEAGHGERTALIYDSPLAEQKAQYSY